MVGFYATADSSQPIRTDLDNELEGEILQIAILATFYALSAFLP
jgi:hypothetical protein